MTFAKIKETSTKRRTSFDVAAAALKSARMDWHEQTEPSGGGMYVIAQGDLLLL